jgi:hypothetical protein
MCSSSRRASRAGELKRLEGGGYWPQGNGNSATVGEGMADSPTPSHMSPGL